MWRDISLVDDVQVGAALRVLKNIAYAHWKDFNGPRLQREARARGNRFGAFFYTGDTFRIVLGLVFQGSFGGWWLCAAGYDGEIGPDAALRLIEEKAISFLAEESSDHAYFFVPKVDVSVPGEELVRAAYRSPRLRFEKIADHGSHDRYRVSVAS